MVHQAATPDGFLCLSLQARSHVIVIESGYFGFEELTKATCYPDKWKIFQEQSEQLVSFPSVYGAPCENSFGIS
jgi:hypothetical protein